jgi:hypothetical protein
LQSVVLLHFYLKNNPTGISFKRSLREMPKAYPLVLFGNKRTQKQLIAAKV